MRTARLRSLKFPACADILSRVALLLVAPCLSSTGSEAVAPAVCFVFTAVNSAKFTNHNHFGMHWAWGSAWESWLLYISMSYFSKAPVPQREDPLAGVQQRVPPPLSSSCPFLTVHSSVGLVPAMNSGHSTDDVAHQKPPGPAPISYRTLVTKPDAQGASGTMELSYPRGFALSILLGVEMLVLEAHISEDKTIR